FFSSRGRHTSFSRDWSSDVCSSDLTNVAMHGYTGQPASDIPQVNLRLYQDGDSRLQLEILDNGSPFDPTARASRDLDESLEEARSEERRVGKEGGARGSESAES